MEFLFNLAFVRRIAPYEVFVLDDTDVSQAAANAELPIHLPEFVDRDLFVVVNSIALIDAKCLFICCCGQLALIDLCLTACPQVVQRFDLNRLSEAVIKHLVSRLLTVHFDVFVPARPYLLVLVNRGRIN